MKVRKGENKSCNQAATSSIRQLQKKTQVNNDDHKLQLDRSASNKFNIKSNCHA